MLLLAEWKIFFSKNDIFALQVKIVGGLDSNVNMCHLHYHSLYIRIIIEKKVTKLLIINLCVGKIAILTHNGLLPAL